MLSYYIEAKELCQTIYIDRRYSNRSRDIEPSSVGPDSTGTRSDRLQYSDSVET